jgi:hypothetical protein
VKIVAFGLGEEAVKPPVCPALPSGTSAYKLMSGDPSGLLIEQLARRTR